MHPVQGQACTNNLGECAAGTDVMMCFQAMAYQCGSGLSTTKGVDDCGGHASPYHYHYDLACDYTLSANGHSALIGLMLDGRGLYGQVRVADKNP